jgi:HEAT repeat protein
MDAERSTQESESPTGGVTSADAPIDSTGVPIDSTDQLPDDLPPVEPPSASFIMQLFLVPGLIVAAVIGVWALFGQVSASEQDWRQMVTEMRSNNEHRRWRGAQGLAQMLQIDHDRGDKGQKLASNPQVAAELGMLLTELLKEKSADKELVRRQLFLTRSMGWLDVHEKVIPALVVAMGDEQDEIVRTDAIRVVALVAGRGMERGIPVINPELSARLIELSADPNPLLRQVCAFTLGLIPGLEADQRLKVLAEDGDWETRVNAALALSRRHMIDGYPVLVSILKTAGQSVDPEKMKGTTEQEKRQRAKSQEAMNSVAVGNVLRALLDIQKQLTNAQRKEALALVTKLSEESEIPRLRIKATETLRLLGDVPAAK